MITIIRDYEKKVINDLIKEYESINGELDKEKKEYLFETLFLCLKEYGKLPKVEGIGLTEKGK